jgi:Site-specific DNA methylase
MKVLDYPGAKWRIADWIIKYFPEHKTYLEPFAGSAAVLFKKEPSRIETINDLEGDVVNLFEVIRRNPERLATEIAATPFSREEYNRSFREKGQDSIQRARQFLIQSWQGYGYRVHEKTGWKNDIAGREYAYACRHWNHLPEAIVFAAGRLKMVQIENMPAIELIKRYKNPDVLIYADPPYLATTRNRKQYNHEMLENHEHMELLEVLKAHSGKVILSGYDNKLYNRELEGWTKKSKQSNAQGGLKRVETIWMNFEPTTQTAIDI